MPKTKAEKQQTIEKLTEKLTQAKSIVFTNYQGLTMQQLTQLRQNLREFQAEYTITKNTLLERALQQSKLPQSDNLLKGPVALLLAFDDEIAPIKALSKAFKEYAVGGVKGGLLAGELIDAQRVDWLAQLPTKNELRAQLIGGIGSPIYGLLGVFQANIRNLVSVLDQIRSAKGGES